MLTSTFDSILAAIETLSIDEQTSLLPIMHGRLSDRRRAEIAANIAQGRQDYQSGNVFRDTVEEAIKKYYGDIEPKLNRPIEKSTDPALRKLYDDLNVALVGKYYPASGG